MQFGVKPLTPERAEEIAKWMQYHRDYLNEVPVGMIMTLQKWAADERMADEDATGKP